MTHEEIAAKQREIGLPEGWSIGGMRQLEAEIFDAETIAAKARAEEMKRRNRELREPKTTYHISGRDFTAEIRGGFSMERSGQEILLRHAGADVFFKDQIVEVT